MKLYTKAVKPIIFLFHPDRVHAIAVKVGWLLGLFPPARSILRKLFVYENSFLAQNIFGITFKNPIGLSGGFDKNAELIRIIPTVGFGFMEVGSITRFPYKGNKRPWSVRLPKDLSLIINYGLKNRGVDALWPTIKQTPKEIPLIVNIAKTNDKSIFGQGTVDDYIYSYKKLEPVADIININISCPNTGDGVLLCEDISLLTRLLEELQNAFNNTQDKKPILVKLKPDLSPEQLTNLVTTVKRYSCVKGYVVSNLSKNRTLLKNTVKEEHDQYSGGISGKPIRDLSTQMIRDVRRLAGNDCVIVGCGGVFTAQDAYEKLKAGANLIELITGLVYQGPSVIKQINKGLVDLLQQDKLSNISEVRAFW